MSDPIESSYIWDPEKRPNTFVVGAPKCGTTALCDYLGQHSDAFVSQPKEPHFFVGDEMPGKAAKFADVEVYARIFSNANRNHKVIAEGSVWYLYSQTALENISRFHPKARIIVMLRRPDEMVYAMHNEAMANFSEDILDFNEAWRTAVAGNQRSSWSHLCEERSKLDYHRIALYSEQLNRLYQYFPKDQVHVIFFDDFKLSTRTCFDEVLEFLSLSHFDADLRKVNESKAVINRVAGKLIRKPPAFIMTLSRLVKRIFKVEKLGWRDQLYAANSKVQARKPIDPVIRLEIIENYRNDIVRLGEMCHRDLSHWLR